MTASTTPPVDAAKADLKRDFRGWNIIHTAQGGWWAQRWPLPPELFNTENLVEARTTQELRMKLRAVTS
ncbi:hypothetical protein [Spirillospora sp. CA-128828]|uniref:hypothetical protein n=1 Tax=Spirillospora sp. CA-128828 TaxID=3240033 RepID=UPI003D8B97FF